MDNNIDKIKSELTEINAFEFGSDAQYVLEEMNRLIERGDVVYLEDFLNLTNEDMGIVNKQNLGWRTTDGMDVQGASDLSGKKIDYYFISGLTDKLVDLSEMPVMTKDDPVDHPSHYTSGGIECIDAIAAALSCHKDPMGAWLTGQIMKYIWRWPLKNGLEDLKKARFYLDRLIKMLEEN